MIFGWLYQFFIPLLLDFSVLYYLTRGPLRRYPLVFVFCTIQILFTCVFAFLDYRLGSPSRTYVFYYWIGDLIAHLFILLVILSLVRNALGSENPRGNLIPIGLFFAMLCVAAGSLYVFQAPLISRWMTPVSRNLSFGEEILNLFLWSLLLSKPDFDLELLTVSAGIGIQVTGEVIGHTLRPYTPRATLWVPNTLVYLSEILCLFVWIWVFRSSWLKSRAPAAKALQVVETGGPSGSV